jgi:hypothetical protein
VICSERDLSYWNTCLFLVVHCRRSIYPFQHGKAILHKNVPSINVYLDLCDVGVGCDYVCL